LKVTACCDTVATITRTEFPVKSRWVQIGFPVGMIAEDMAY